MPNCFAMGEAAGTAAAILSKAGENKVRSIDIKNLQRALVRQGAWLGEAAQGMYSR